MTSFREAENATPSWRRLGAIGLLALAAAAAIPGTAGWAEDLEAATAAKLGDYRAAITRWYAFAQQGDADSAYRLGQAYETGHGVARDLRQAQSWYNFAAAHGSGPAAYSLGLMAESTERPDGTPQDLDGAIAWYRQALAAGDPRARERLAALGAGEGELHVARPSAPAPAPADVAPPAVVRAPEPRPQPPPDPAISFGRALANWRTHGLDGTDSSTIAALETAARQGDPLAQYDIAYAYEHGLGVPAQPARAYAWYKRAEASAGPPRLRDAARTNGRLLGAKLSDTEKQAAAQIDTEWRTAPIDR
ncbi:MAG TPA: tetratricopeptide repeat protein [Aliidongia sp.]|nr:tetratricopeptide repeat protein [Aliidongia sp.]